VDQDLVLAQVEVETSQLGFETLVDLGHAVEEGSPDPLLIGIKPAGLECRGHRAHPSKQVYRSTTSVGVSAASDHFAAWAGRYLYLPPLFNWELTSGPNVGHWGNP
jgi:hypothetical protein